MKCPRCHLENFYEDRHDLDSQWLVCRTPACANLMWRIDFRKAVAA